MFDYLVVGAGFAGAVMAERLASDAGRKVLLVDKRLHVGGNAHDAYDTSGILVHTYGPHIFHTNSRDVFDYLSQFHRIGDRISIACGRGSTANCFRIPINLDTVNRLYGLNLTSFELEQFFASVAEPRSPARTSEDVIVEQGRARAVQQVLSQLHAQAVGPRSLGVGRVRHGARSGSHQSRRPLLHRYLSGDAAARLHSDVRADALASEHQGHVEHGLPRHRWRHPVRRNGLHGPDRRVLRLSLRQAALPLARVPVRDLRPACLSGCPGRELPERESLHARAPNSSTSPARSIRRPASSTSIHEPRAIRTTRCRARRTPRCTGSTRRSRNGRRTCTSAAVWRPTGTTTWIRWWHRRWRSTDA